MIYSNVNFAPVFLLLSQMQKKSIIVTDPMFLSLNRNPDDVSFPVDIFW